MIEQSNHTAIRATKTFLFPISPFPWVRVTDDDLIWLRMPEDQIRSEAGLRRRHRILAYYQYKENIAAYAKQHGFVLEAGVAIHFFLPIAIRRTMERRRELHFARHLQKPDLSNLLKAFEDALTKKDEVISHYTGLDKFWVDTLLTGGRNKTIGPGWIEVH